MGNEIKPQSFGTHDGTFHADEVTACALLVQFDLVDRRFVQRTRNTECLKQCEYVCDVGGEYVAEKKRFDHHQVEYHGALSSAGMILKYLKETGILAEKTAHFLNQSLIIGIDAHDNGNYTPLVGHCSFSGVVSNFVPVEYGASSEEMDHAFFKALDFVLGHIDRLIDRFSYIQKCRGAVEEAMQTTKKYLVFSTSLPWLESFFELGGEEHPALFLVMPSKEHWKLRGIPPTLENRMRVRQPLPKEWSGLSGEELQKVTGIPGAIFCHKGQFISVWETKEDAMQALEHVIGEL